MRASDWLSGIVLAVTSFCSLLYFALMFENTKLGLLKGALLFTVAEGLAYLCFGGGPKATRGSFF